MEKFLSNFKEVHLSNTTKAAAVAVGSGLALAWFLHRIRKRNYPSPWARGPAEILVPDYEKDKVYLFQFPSSQHIVNLSPFCLKLETFLRLKKISYESKPTLDKWSKYGKMPFVEFNGEHLADSVLIIQELTKRLNLPDENLTAQERGQLHAAAMMMDNNTGWSYGYYRYMEAMDVVINEFGFIPWYYKWIIKNFYVKEIKTAAEKHGIGRHSREEIYEFGFHDLQALSDMLGDKPFFAGKQITTVDCTVFAHLAQIVYIPIKDSPHFLYMQEHCSNLLEYVERVKTELWPDWEDRLSKD